MMMYCKRQFIDLMVETRHTDLQSGAKERSWFTYHKFFFFFFFLFPTRGATLHTGLAELLMDGVDGRY